MTDIIGRHVARKCNLVNCDSNCSAVRRMTTTVIMYSLFTIVDH